MSDSSQVAVPGVAVTVVNEGTGAKRHLVTDAIGISVGAELPVGYYTVRYEAPSFGKVERQRVKVDVGGARGKSKQPPVDVY